MFGWIKDSHDPRDYVARTSLKKRPARVDMRGGFPDVYNQGALGSCTAWGTLAVAQYTAIETSGDADKLAALFLYFNTRGLQGTIDEDSGASIRNAMKALAKWGSCNEATWPYAVKKFKVKPSDAAYEEASHRTLTAKHYARVNQDHESIKQQLAAGNPVVFGTPLFESFQHIGKDGHVPMPTRGEDMIGGHCMCIVGYDDAKGWYILRNSWGRSFGDNGYCYMPYDYMAKYGSDLWTIMSVPYKN